VEFVDNMNIVTYLGVCMPYRRDLDGPDLLHTYTTCYCTSQTTICHTVSSLHHLRLPSPCRAQLSTDCSLGTPELKWLFSSELFFITDFQWLSRKHNYSNTSFVVYLPIPCLETGYCYLIVHFRGNLFTEPLPSNELFRLSGVMSIFLTYIPYFENESKRRPMKSPCCLSVTPNF
jgi:hypothetical protein